MHILQKTALTLALLAITSTSTNAQIRRTSTDLSREEVLPTVATSAPLIPVGALQMWPSNIPPSNLPNWLECNGQAIPAGAKYDRLRAVLGSNHVPDYSKQFLRPTTDSSLTGVTVADSIKSHTVDVPGQSANVSASVDNTSVSGTAAPQAYSYQTTSESMGAFMIGAQNATVIVAPWGNEHGVANNLTSGGTINGTLNNGHVTGQAAVQPTTGVYSGSSETAPTHTYIKLYIRAVQ